MALLAVAAALSGCSGGQAQQGAGSGSNHSSAVATRGDGPAGLDQAPKPTWAVGDAWTYELDGQPTTYVVTGQTATDWIMETDSPERAFADARDDISRLGPQRKSDLAGSQGDDRVEFFRWPLSGGQSWTTTWDGFDVEISVLGGDTTFQELSARVVGAPPEDPPLYTYTYDGGAGWFGELTRFEPDGSAAVHLVLTEARHAWTGSIARWDLQTIQAAEGSNGAAVGGPFEVAAGTTDLWAEYHFTCTGAAGWSILVAPANPGLAGPQGQNAGGQCVQVDFEDVLQAAPHPGTWAFALSVGGETADFEYAILARTLVESAFP